jgi:hypothetical protein
MNDNRIDAEQVQNQFATAVRNFTPKPSAKFEKLLPFKDGIVELRRKGASYAIIADLLRSTNVAVSHDTVARFCREVLKLTPRTRRPRNASAKTLQHDPMGNPKANLVRKADSSCAIKPSVQSEESGILIGTKHTYSFERITA